MQLSLWVLLPCGAGILLMAGGLATAQQLPEAPSAQNSGQKSAPAKPAESAPPPTPPAQAAPQNPADQTAAPKPVVPAAAERHYRQAIQYEKEATLATPLWSTETRSRSIPITSSRTSIWAAFITTKKGTLTRSTSSKKPCA